MARVEAKKPPCHSPPDPHLVYDFLTTSPLSHRSDSPDRPASAWREALSSDRPAALDLKIDPDVAPLPAHVTLKEARSFMPVMAKRDRSAGRVIGGTARQVVDGLFGKKD